MFADATETLVHLMKFIFYLYAYDFTLLMHLYLFNNSWVEHKVNQYRNLGLNYHNISTTFNLIFYFNSLQAINSEKAFDLINFRTLRNLFERFGYCLVFDMFPRCFDVKKPLLLVHDSLLHPQRTTSTNTTFYHTELIKLVRLTVDFLGSVIDFATDFVCSASFWERRLK